MIEHKIYHQPNLNLNGTYKLRNAVRAVIIKNGIITLAFLDKTKEFKFPGGGIKNGESHEDALRREVNEEIGASVKSIKEKIAVIQEFDRFPEDIEDYFTMISHYYLVDIENELGSQNLDVYEKDLGFNPVEVTISEAILVNRKNIESKNSHATKWIIRETYMLEKLNEIYN
jgi:ADP-ribose pyrophosphatase YjhB (NUDIX family)